MFLFSTDIDGTVYDGPESAAAFSQFWKALASELDAPPVLAYNTGRSIADTRELVRTTPLPEPDWLITGVGTEIYDVKGRTLMEHWIEHLSPDWHFDTVWQIVEDSTPAQPQPDECQSQFKCSWYWNDTAPEEIDALERRIRDAGMDAQAVYSSNRDLDLLPARANKGNAVAFLAAELGVPIGQVVVAGDSGNDASMYEVEGIRGVVVANAEAALRAAVAELPVYFAESPCIAGVIEGIGHYRASGALTLAQDPEKTLS